MSRTEAIAVEITRYVSACNAHDTHRAHIHLRAIDRLRYPYVTAGAA